MLQKSKLLKIILAPAIALFLSCAALQANPENYWDVEPIVVRQIAPKNTDNLTGKVFVKIDIDDWGHVSKATIHKSTNKRLNKMVLKAVEKWKFKPARAKGQRIACTITVPFNFKS